MEKKGMFIIKVGFIYFIGRFLITIIFNVQFKFWGVSNIAPSIYICIVNIYNFMDELYYLLDINEISLQDNVDRDKAIRLLLKTKRRVAKVIVNDIDILNEYDKKGMEGIKRFFNRKICYLYHTRFVYDVLFYHYKNDWRELETIIKNKINA